MPDKVFRLIIDVDSRKGQRGAKEAETSMARLQNRIAQVGAAAGAAGVAIGAMVLRSSIRNHIEQAQALAQVESVIKSTGGSAQLTSRQLQDMASDIQKVTTAGDESILRMQGLLLTFKSVKGDEFRRATELIVDMSQKMGSLESNAILLGKALDDPAKRASELSRSGIVLTETQKDLIRQLDATGQRAKAQGIILDEIASQFGGAGAAAAAAAGGGITQFKNAIGDLSEILGGPITARLDEMSRSMNEFATDQNTAAGIEFLGELIANLSRGMTLAQASAQAMGDAMSKAFSGDTVTSGMERFVAETGRFEKAVEDATDSTEAWDAATERMLRDAAKPLQAQLVSVNAEIDAHEAKLVAIEKQYRENVTAIREWLKNIQDLEQNFEEFANAVDLGGGGAGGLAGLGDIDLSAIDEATKEFTESIMEGFELPDGVIKKLGDEFGEIWARAVANALGDALTAVLTGGEIDWEQIGGALGTAAGTAAANAIAPGTGPIGGVIGGAIGSVIGGSFSNKEEEEAIKAAQDAFKSLVDLVRSSMPQIRQQVIATFDTINEMLRLMGEASGTTGEEMAAVNRELQNTADAITGIASGDFADRLRAAQEFNQTLLTLPQDIQAAFEAIDLPGLADSIVAEFLGITSQLDLAAIERDAQELRSAINGLGLESQETAALLRQVRDAERLRTQELRAGVLAQLADLMERAGIRSAEAAKIRAQYEQIQFQVALKRLEVELRLLDMWSKATAAIIGELTKFASDLGNFVGSISSGVGSVGQIRIPRRRRGGGSSRRQRRQSLLDELDRLMNPSGGASSFTDRLRALNQQFADLRKQAIKLKVPLAKVNAAYQQQLKLLKEQASASLRSFRDDLLGGDLSTLSLQEKFFRARGRFNDLARRAQAGDLDAISELGSAGQEYLRLAQLMFGSTSQYKAIFDEVLGLVNGVLGAGGLSDKETERHNQVVTKMDDTNALRVDLHNSANNWRERNYQKNRDNGRELRAIRAAIERLEAA